MELGSHKKEENIYYENPLLWNLYQVVKIHIDNLMNCQVK